MFKKRSGYTADLQTTSNLQVMLRKWLPQCMIGHGVLILRPSFSWSIPYLKTSIQMFSCPWLICAEICPHKTTCPVSHTCVRTPRCLQFFRDRGVLVPSWWACIYHNNSRSEWSVKWGEQEKNSLQNTQQKRSAFLSGQIWFKYLTQHPRKTKTKTKTNRKQHNNKPLPHHPPIPISSSH